MIKLSPDKIRSVIADCKTEQDIVNSLRTKKIKYSFSTAPGFLSIRIPCRKGSIIIYRTCSRSAPFMVKSVSPVPFIPVSAPVYHAE